MKIKQRWDNFPFSPSKSRIFYGWIILFAGTIGVLVSAPGQTVGVSVFTDYLIKAVGVTRDNLSLAYMGGTIGSSLVLTWGGRMYDKYGARIVGVVVSVCLGCVLFLFSQSDHIVLFLSRANNTVNYTWVAVAVFIVLFFMLRFTGQGILTMVSRNMIMKWFIKRRGLANGISAVFVSFGFSMAPIIFNLFIDEFSWRGGYVIMAVFTAVFFALFVFLFFRDNPESLGLLPDGEKSGNMSKDVIIKPFKQFTLKEARSTYAFWMFTLPLAIYALYITGFTFHLTSIFGNAGLTKEMALGVFVPMSFISVTISLVGGYVSDKIKLRYLLYIITLSQVLALFCLARLDSGAYYIGFIIGNGISSGLYSVLMAVTWPRFFGREHLGKISGMVMAVIVFASALGPMLFSFSLSGLGSYSFSFYAVMFLSLTLFFLSLRTRNPQYKFRGD